MEVLLRYGTKAQQERWLRPLLLGTIRSCFAMTEPAVASSDATNVTSSIVRRGDSYVVNGRKWWTSGACDPRCELAIFMGKTTPDGTPGVPKHRQQTMVLVPMRAKGVTVVRPLPVFGYDDAPHGHAETTFEDVVVSVKDAELLGEGRGFEIAQGRWGPGRLHHCMRLIGMGERALTLAARRAEARVAFGQVSRRNFLPNQPNRPVSHMWIIFQYFSTLTPRPFPRLFAAPVEERERPADARPRARHPGRRQARHPRRRAAPRRGRQQSCQGRNRGVQGCRARGGHRGDRRGDTDSRRARRVRRHPSGADVRRGSDASAGGRAGRGSPGDHSQARG